MNNMKHPMLCGACIAVCTASALIVRSEPLFVLYLPVLVCCMVCPWQYGLICAVCAPVFAAVISGLLSGVQLIPTMAETAAASLTMSASLYFVRTGRARRDILISTVLSVVIGKIVGAFVYTAFFSAGKTAAFVWSGVSLIRAALNIALLPGASEVIFPVLESTGFAEKRGT